MLVARKNNADIYIQDEDAEGFEAAGYQLFRQELVPVNAHSVSVINNRPEPILTPTRVETPSNIPIPEYPKGTANKE